MSIGTNVFWSNCNTSGSNVPDDIIYGPSLPNSPITSLYDIFTLSDHHHHHSRPFATVEVDTAELVEALEQVRLEVEELEGISELGLIRVKSEVCRLFSNGIGLEISSWHETLKAKMTVDPKMLEELKETIRRMGQETPKPTKAEAETGEDVPSPEPPSEEFGWLYDSRDEDGKTWRERPPAL